jgi:hypothetical protein
MLHDIRTLLDRELAEEQPPPLGELVRDAVHRGRRMRRRRRMLAGSGTAAGVTAIVVAAALLGGGAPPDRTAAPGAASSATAQDATARATTAPPTAAKVRPGKCPIPPDMLENGGLRGFPQVTDISCPFPHQDYDLSVPDAPAAGKRVTGTARGALELLTRLLPKGAPTSGYAQGDGEGPGSSYVQIYVDRGKGPGMIRLRVDQDGRKPSAEESRACRGDETCYPLPGGGKIVLINNEGNCVEGTIVDLWRADGASLSLRIGTCLMWDGKQNPKSAQALTVQEAITLVLDPRWGERLPKEIVDAGAAHFARLPHIQGG